MPRLQLTTKDLVVGQNDGCEEGIVRVERALEAKGLIGRGIAVPEAVSLVGCDDVLGAMTVPPLTLVSSRSREAGETAVSLLADMLGLGATRDVRYVLDTHLVVRATTARVGP